MSSFDKNSFYSIGKVSRLTGLSIPAIRYYDRIGLVAPAVRDRVTGYRYYDESQIMSFYTISELKAIGMDLEQIAAFIQHKNPYRLQETIREILRGLRSQMQDLENRMQATERVYSSVVEGMNLLDESLDRETGSAELLGFSILDIEGSWILSTRKREPLDADVLFVPRCMELQEIRNRYGLLSTGPFFAIFHSGYQAQVQKEEGDMELCLRVIRPEGFSRPELRFLPPHKAAGAIYIGRYADMEATYHMLQERIEQEGYRITGPAKELYFLDPLATDDESQYVTRIEFPVMKTETV